MNSESVKQPWDSTAFDVFSHDGTMNPDLRLWFETQGIEPAIVRSPHSLVCDRNASVDFFLRQSKAEHLCMIDADMFPLPESLGILVAPGDLVYCGYSARHGCVAHYGDGDLGMGCMRMSRAVLEKIEPPWFNFEFNARGVAVLKCECRVFLEKAKAAGFDSAMVGVMGHIMPMVARPDPSNPSKMQVLHPEIQRRQQRLQYRLQAKKKVNRSKR